MSDGQKRDHKKTYGTLYSVGEAQAFLRQQREQGQLDIYPYEMFTWLCDRVVELEKQLSAKLGVREEADVSLGEDHE